MRRVRFGTIVKHRVAMGIGASAVAVAVAVAVTVVAASPRAENPQHVKAGKAKARGESNATSSTTTSSTTTTGAVPYGKQSVTLSGLAYTASKGSTTISGSFAVTNTGNTPMVVVDSQRIGVEYRGSKPPYTAMADPSCTFEPAVPYTISGQQAVNFTCTLGSAIPKSAQYVRVTATVTLLGSTTTYSTSAERAV